MCPGFGTFSGASSIPIVALNYYAVEEGETKFDLGELSTLVLSLLVTRREGFIVHELMPIESQVLIVTRSTTRV
ncbi:hypothetical protein M407DRAFT_245424, partial [Tulasnella calospora MUT 4182]